MSNENTLMNITADMNLVVAKILENGGELSLDLETEFSAVGEQLQQKTDAYAFYIDRLESEADFWKAKAEIYLKTAKACGNLKDRLKNNIKTAMQIMDVKEIQGSDMRFTLSSSKPSLVIDEAKLDPAYMMQVTETVADKERIKADLEIGVPIIGAKYEPSYSLRKYPNSKKAIK